MVKVTLLQERLVPGLKEKPAQQKIIILSHKRHVRSKIETAEFKPFQSHLQSLEMAFVQLASIAKFISKFVFAYVRRCGCWGGGGEGDEGGVKAVVSKSVSTFVCV